MKQERKNPTPLGVGEVNRWACFYNFIDFR